MGWDEFYCMSLRPWLRVFFFLSVLNILVQTTLTFLGDFAKQREKKKKFGSKKISVTPML